MLFFTESDFDFFSSLRHKTYDKNNLVHRNNGKILLETVYAKTEHWANLLKIRGYGVEVSRKWQNSGYYRSYTWAKIFPPEVENEKVFFTIGVGSRLSEKGEVNTLEYKLDCQWSNKGALDPSMVWSFNKYLMENCPEASRVIIDIEEALILGWEGLVQRTIDFMTYYQQHYFNLLELTSIGDGNLAKKIARLCWNEYSWTKPSGPIGKSKSSSDAFEKEKGYGYEEWLFNTNMKIGDYRYGFIQAFNKGDHQGRNYDVQLYSIHNENRVNTYYWVGRIIRLEILTVEQQKEMVAEYKIRGWKDRMLLELNEVGVADFDYGPIDEHKIFNVRYKVDPTNFVCFENPIIIENPEAELGRNRHYVSLPKKTDTLLDEISLDVFKFKEGHQEVSTETVYGKRKKIEFLMQLKHRTIQKEIYEQLKAEFEGTLRQVGTENPTGYNKFVDLVVSCPKEGITFYEIKTAGSALQCIREAIGQLFEYAFYRNSQFAQQFVVVGLVKNSKALNEYLLHLECILGIRICYQFFNEKTRKLER